MLPRYPTLTILAFGGIMLLTDVVPALHDYKVMDWANLPRVLDFVDRNRSAAPELEEQQRLRPETDPSRQARYPLDDNEHDLDHFYQALHKAEGRGQGAEVRILHYGDSPTTADLITSDARALLQKQFGDAGHGFCLIAKPWAWYAHRGADVEGSGWIVDPVNQSSIKDGLFGLGGVSFRGGPGATARVKLGGPHTRIEVAFLQQPGGGQLRVFAADRDLGVVNTGGPKLQSGFASFPLPPEARQVSVQALSGPVRLFGMMFSKDSPGVVYHSLGVNGAYVSVLAKFFNEAHWREQLQHYKPHLVIVNYGTNESVYPQFVDYASEKELREIVRRLRSALPGASILVMSPMDRGQRMATGEIGTVPAIPRLVAIQRRVAADTGSAFFNTFEAMGGLGTMGRWYAAEPRLVGADFIHPMPGGAKIVGGLLYQALLHGYNQYKLRLIQQKSMVAGK
ncbi:MAG: hypothetical protein JNK48_03320 [Bryobacterales bacterium]|nr:hypothetical protein [Bryobacterales bacterium]